MAVYKAPVKDIQFVLNEVLDVSSLSRLPGYEDATPDTIEAILEEAAKISENVLFPLNGSGDEEGCHYENGVVRTPKGFKHAYDTFREGGWTAVTCAPEYGGQGLPATIGFALTEMFTAGEADKTYLALAKGRFQKESGSIDLRLAERQQTFTSKQQRGVNMQQARTHWRKLAGGPEATLLELTIETGRTHQIRRHLEAIGHPIVGDGKYGDFPFNRLAQRQWGLKRMFLHSQRLSLPHPLNRKRLVFVSPLPDELAQVLPRAGIQAAG